MREGRVIASWALALFLAAMLLWIADQTLFPGEGRNVVFPTLAEKSGYYLFEPTGRYVVSLLEVLAAILLVLPWTRRIGAGLAVLVTAGAVGAHLTPWLGIQIPTTLAPATDVPASTDGGQLFYLSLGLLVASLIVFFVHPGKSGAGARTGGYGYYGGR
ncbi:MAG TPA: hypothetical protein VFV70_16320 [Hyphomonadaceae bacterium]|nr:hypothetical protein [Hyphomonadaceae bacterium]